MSPYVLRDQENVINVVQNKTDLTKAIQHVALIQYVRTLYVLLQMSQAISKHNAIQILNVVN